MAAGRVKARQLGGDPGTRTRVTEGVRRGVLGVGGDGSIWLDAATVGEQRPHMAPRTKPRRKRREYYGDIKALIWRKFLSLVTVILRLYLVIFI